MKRAWLALVLISAAAIGSLAREHGLASEPTPVAAATPMPGAAAGGTDEFPSAGLVPPLQAAPAWQSLPHTAGCGAGLAAGDQVGVLEGRAYRLHVPASHDSGQPAALVLNFHGFGQSPAQQEAYSGLVPLSDREGFILVTPEGSGSPPGWNIVGVYAEDGVDDVAFVADLVGAIEDAACVNPGRVYAIGMSNGAEMAAQLACDLPGAFAAVASVAGLVYQGCSGAGVAVVAFHGTDDGNVLYDWIPGEWRGWANHDGCSGSVVQQLTQHVSLLSATGCAAGTDVMLYTIDGGGHTWPGAADNSGGVGYTTHEIDAAGLAWQFFAAHARS